MSLLPGLAPTPFDEREFYTDPPPPTGFGDYLGAKLGEGFDFSTTGRAVETFQEPAPAYRGRFHERVNAQSPSPPAMTEEEWRSSRFRRDGIAWQPGMTEPLAAARAEAYDRRRWRDTLVDRYQGGFLGRAAGFVAGMAGGAPALENIVPFLGPGAKAAAVARLGYHGGRAAAAAAEGAIGNAALDLLVLPEMARRGEDAGVADFAIDLAAGALTGGLFGAAGGVLEARADRRAAAVDRVLSQSRTEDVQRQLDATNLAMDQLAHDEPVAAAVLLRGEQERVAKAHDQVLASPKGPPDDPLVRITPEEIEGTIIERGAFKDLGELEVKGRSGWGLLKFIWRHGEKSPKAPEVQITRQDVVDFPRVIREYEASADRDGGRSWVVDKPDGRRVVYADAAFTATDGQRRVVSMFVVEPDKLSDYQLSPRRTDPPGSLDGGVSAPGKDTPPKPYDQPSESPDGSALRSPASGDKASGGDTAPGTYPRPSESPAPDNMPPRPRPVNLDAVEQAPEPHPSVTEAAPRVGRSPKSKAEELQALAQDMGVEEPPELADIEVLRRDGRLTEADEAALAEADELAKTAEGWADSYLILASCVLRNAV